MNLTTWIRIINFALHRRMSHITFIRFSKDKVQYFTFDDDTPMVIEAA